MEFNMWLSRFNSQEFEIIRKMRQLDTVFAETGEFKPALIKTACDALGVPPKWSIRDKSQPVSRGVYLMHGDSSENAVKQSEPEAVPALVAAVERKVVPFKQSAVRQTLVGAVPPVDPKYVPFGNYKDIEKIIKSRKFFPVLVTGHSGNGKSTTIMQIHAKNDMPIIRLNMTKRTDEEVLIGSKTLVDGNVVVIEGPILIAMRQGCTVLLDEVDAAESNTIMCLQSILEGKPYYFSAIGEYIKPETGFNIIMTANTKGQGSEDGRYIGTQILNEAFLERIAFTFEQEFPTPAVEKKIVMNIMEENGCVDEKFAEELVKWADAIRRSFADGAVDSLIATRRLEHIVRGFSLFKDKKKAVELAVNRFDSMTKQAFFELFDKISTEEVVPAVCAAIDSDVDLDAPPF
jgi:hypothetical protein